MKSWIKNYLKQKKAKKLAGWRDNLHPGSRAQVVDENGAKIPGTVLYFNAALGKYAFLPDNAQSSNNPHQKKHAELFPEEL